MHKVTQLSEAETSKEIADITGNAFEQRDKNGDLIDPNAQNCTHYEATMVAMRAQEASQVIAPKRRGRPKGSRNKPKS